MVIKRNHEMQQYGSKYFAVRPLHEPDPPSRTPDPGVGIKRSKFFFFHNMVMLHIELKNFTNAAAW